MKLDWDGHVCLSSAIRMTSNLSPSVGHGFRRLGLGSTTNADSDEKNLGAPKFDVRGDPVRTALIPPWSRPNFEPLEHLRFFLRVQWSTQVPIDTIPKPEGIHSSGHTTSRGIA